MDRNMPGAVRRNLYWIAVLPLILIPVGAWLMVSHDENAQGAVFWAGFAAAGLGIVAFCAAAGSRFQPMLVQEERLLDEREVAQRHKASAHAFRAYWFVTLLGCCYLLFAPRLHAPVPVGHDWIWVMIVLADLFFLLPIAILEWTSDPLDAEEER